MPHTNREARSRPYPGSCKEDRRPGTWEGQSTTYPTNRSLSIRHIVITSLRYAAISLTRRVRGCTGMVEFIKAVADVVRPVTIDGRSIITA